MISCELVAGAVLQMLTETDVDGLIGAGHYERSGERIDLAQRSTRTGARHPVGVASSCGSRKLRQGKLLTVVTRGAEGFGEGGGLLIGVIQEAKIGGVSTRRVDESGAGDGAERDEQVAGLCGSDNRCGG